VPDTHSTNEVAGRRSAILDAQPSNGKRQDRPDRNQNSRQSSPLPRGHEGRLRYLATRHVARGFIPGERRDSAPQGTSSALGLQNEIPIAPGHTGSMRGRPEGRMGLPFSEITIGSHRAARTSEALPQDCQRSWTPRDLKIYCGRHTFGTVATVGTKNPYVVMKGIGHEDLDTTKCACTTIVLNSRR
jgi:hypothetical protein